MIAPVLVAPLAWGLSLILFAPLWLKLSENGRAVGEALPLLLVRPRELKRELLVLLVLLLLLWFKFIAALTMFDVFATPIFSSLPPITTCTFSSDVCGVSSAPLLLLLKLLELRALGESPPSLVSSVDGVGVAALVRQLTALSAELVVRSRGVELVGLLEAT